MTPSLFSSPLLSSPLLSHRYVEWHVTLMKWWQWVVRPSNYCGGIKQCLCSPRKFASDTYYDWRDNQPDCSHAEILSRVNLWHGAKGNKKKQWISPKELKIAMEGGQTSPYRYISPDSVFAVFTKVSMHGPEVMGDVENSGTVNKTAEDFAKCFLTLVDGDKVRDEGGGEEKIGGSGGVVCALCMLEAERANALD